MIFELIFHSIIGILVQSLVSLELKRRDEGDFWPEINRSYKRKALLRWESPSSWGFTPFPGLLTTPGPSRRWSMGLRSLKNGFPSLEAPMELGTSFIHWRIECPESSNETPGNYIVSYIHRTINWNLSTRCKSTITY